MPAAALSASGRYDRLSIFLHWATVLVIAASFASIESRVLFERGTALRTGVKELHYVLGLVILLMTLARLFHRLGRSSHPPVTPRLPDWQDRISRLMHGILYGVLLLLPVMGLLTVSALGDQVNLGFGLHLPALMAPNEALGEWLEAKHSLLGDTLYLLIGGHAVAALAHHYLRRDDTLLRITPLPARR